MDNETAQLISKFNSLNQRVDALTTIVNFHRHKGYDSTSVLLPDYKRIKLFDQATITTDATQGRHFYTTLAGNRTLANPIGASAGQRIIFELIQDNTGSRTITLGSKFNAGGFTITLTTTANKRDFIEVVYSDVDDKFYVINFVKNY